MKKQLIRTVAVAAILLATQAASGAAPESVDRSQLNWPAVDKVWLETGTFVNIDNLRRVAPGVSKDQLYDLLGRPHFTTGMFNVREWDYLFNFRTGKGDEYVSCQFKVLFDEYYLAKGLYWKNPACAAFLDKPAPVIQQVIVPAPPPPPATKKITLATDGLFRFAGGTLADLQPEGLKKIQGLTADILRDTKQIRLLSVTGHADRIGSPSDNLVLSLQRAQTVRDLMVQGGIPANMIRVTGMGAQQPLVECAGAGRTPELVGCLQPNRRVEIEVVGE